MIDPSLLVSAAIIDRLKSDAPVTAIVSQRVFDVVPPGIETPYITLGQPQVLPSRTGGAGCDSGAEISIVINGWTTGPESVASRQLGAAIVASIDEHELVMSGHRTVLCELEQNQYLEDPDGITKHSASTFRILTEPT
jgi:hypothetical protein